MIRQALVKDGVDVISINRSGKPDSFRPPLNAVGKVEWLKGDIFNSSTWFDAINAADGAVSCVGAFGSNEVSCISIYMHAQHHSTLELYSLWRR